MPDSDNHFRRARIVSDEAQELHLVANRIGLGGVGPTERVGPTRRMPRPESWDSSVAEERTRQLAAAQGSLDEAGELLEELAARLYREAGEREAEAEFHWVRGWIEVGRERGLKPVGCRSPVVPCGFV